MVRSLQCFFIALLLVLPCTVDVGSMKPGETHRLTFRDIVIVAVTRQSEEQARHIFTLVPDHCIGDPKYRYITLVNFQKGLARPLQGITRAVIRNRLDAEAEAL